MIKNEIKFKLKIYENLQLKLFFKLKFKKLF